MKVLNIKILLIATITALLFVCSCSKETAQKIEMFKNIAENANDESFMAREDIEAKLKNFSITMKVTENGNVTKWTEIKTENGFYLNTNDSNIIYSDFKSKKYYILDEKEKTGVAMLLTSDEVSPFAMMGAGITPYLYFFEAFRFLGAKKGGTETVSGRSTIVYTYNLNDIELKMWLDKEYGICIKYESKENGKVSKMEIVDAKFGNASIGNLVDLSKYKIQEININP